MEMQKTGERMYAKTRKTNIKISYLRHLFESRSTQACRTLALRPKKGLDQRMKKFALMLTIAIFFLAFFHQATAANHSQPLLETLPQIGALELNPGTVDCSKITDDLAEFKLRYMVNAKLVSEYVLSMSKVSEQWYLLLSPLEKTAVQFEAGTFAPISQTASAINTSVEKIGEWISQVDRDLEAFAQSIGSCKMTKAEHEKWVNAFQLFSEKNGENLGVSVEYISSLATEFSAWNTKWSQMETREVLLQAGEFDVVMEASQGLFESADLIQSNAQIAVDDLGGISLKELRNGRGANDGTLQLHRR